MKHPMVILGTVLTLAVSAPALAQTVKKFEFKGTTPVTSPAVAPATTTAKAPFGCEARAPKVCHFVIFYARGSRDVVLPAGMKQAIPEVRIGSDSYCVAVNTKPVWTCARKTIKASYNS